MTKKTKQYDTQFVFIGKDYKSKQRSQERIQNLLAKGYEIVSQNNKKATLKKQI